MEIKSYNFSDSDSGIKSYSSSNKLSSGEDIKDAFLSLLSSLVAGASLSNPNIQNIMDTAKIDFSRPEKNDQQLKQDDVLEKDQFINIHKDQNDTESNEASLKTESSSILAKKDDNSTNQETVSEEVEVLDDKVNNIKSESKAEVVDTSNEDTTQVVETGMPEVGVKKASTNYSSEKVVVNAPTEEVKELESVVKSLNESSNLAAKSKGEVINNSEKVITNPVTQVGSDSENIKDKVSKKLEVIVAQKRAYDESLNSNLSEDKSSNYLLKDNKNNSNILSSTLIEPGIKKSVDGVNLVANIGAKSNSLEGALSLSKSNNLSQKIGDINSSLLLQGKSSLEKQSTERLSSSSVQRKPLESQAFVDKVKEVLEKLSLAKTNDSITIKIDPAHLGEITVKVTQKLGEIHAKIMPESKEVEKTLTLKSSELSLVIQALGFREDQVKVTIGRNGEDFTQQNLEQDNRFSNHSEFRNSNQELKSDKKSFREEDALGMFLGLDSEDSGVGGNSKAGIDVSGWVA